MNDTRKAAPLSILGVVLVYAAFGALWILLSDKLLEWLIRDAGTIALVSMFKGWFFIGVTSLLLYYLLRRVTGVRGEGVLSLPRLPFGLAAIAILATTGIGIAYSLVQRQEIETERVRAIADLKAEQLSNWLDRLQRDAEFIHTSNYYFEQVSLWRRGDQAAGARFRARLQQFLNRDTFSGAVLLTPDGQRLWFGQSERLLHDSVTQAARAAARDGRVRRIDPHHGPDGALCIDYVVPLSSQGVPASVLILRVDSESWLFPTLHDWPGPSQSGEIALVRRDGDQVLHLNDLRHRPHAALDLRVSMHDEALISVQALNGKVSPEGVDYRGVAVIGAAYPVDGTDWILIAKMDRDEIYEVAALDMFWIVLAGLLGLFMAGAALLILRQREQLRAHRALELLAAIADGSEDAIFAKDREGRYLLFNKAASRFVGQAAGKVLGRDDRGLFPPDQAEQLMAIGRRVMEREQTEINEETLSTTEGTRVFLATKGPLRDHEGHVIGLFGISRDITRQKRDEDALRASESRFRALFENSLDAVLLTTPEGGIVAANAQAERLFGYSEAELCRLGQTALVEADDPRMAEVLDERARTGRFVGELTLRRQDGTRFPADLSSSVFRDVTGQPVTSLVVRDISARMAAEASLRERNDELERFNRATIGRELDMIALKRRINELSVELGRAPPYPLAFDQDEGGQP